MPILVMNVTLIKNVYTCDECISLKMPMLVTRTEALIEELFILVLNVAFIEKMAAFGWVEALIIKMLVPNKMVACTNVQ